MLRNYLTIAWRNLLRHKVFSLINILGLAMGMAACLLIFTYVQHEFTYDTYHEKADRIYRVTSRIRTPGVDMHLALSDVPLAPALKADFPEVQQAVRFQPVAPTVRYQNQFFKEKNVYFADQAVFDVFTYPFVKGSLQGALSQPHCVVLTESLSKKYFGNTEPMGATMYFDKQAYTVTGILKDLPTNSDLKFDALLSARFSKAATWFMEDPSVYTFVLLHPQSDAQKFWKKLSLIFEKYYKPVIMGMSEEAVPNSMKSKIFFDFSLEALPDIHYNKELLADTPKGNRDYNYIFSITALFILLIALLNYINLTTSKSAERAKEVGIRKMSGAYRKQLIGQFLFESLLLTVLSVGLAFTLFQIILPSFNRLFQVQLNPVWHQNWLLMLGLFLLVTLAAGAYPAFVLSAFQPIRVLKGKFLASAKGIPLRQSLIVVQFMLATGMIIGAFMTFRQMHHLRVMDLGFNKEQALVISLPEDSLVRQSLPALKNEFLARNQIGR